MFQDILPRNLHIKKMSCFIKTCTTPCIENFICSCNEEKKTCSWHKEIIKYQRVSCIIGHKCFNCGNEDFLPRLITITSLIGVDFIICKKCSLESIDPWIAHHLFDDQQTPVTLNPSALGKVCNKCSKCIEQVRKPKTTIMLSSGWTWSDGKTDHTFCKSCISFCCSSHIEL